MRSTVPFKSLRTIFFVAVVWAALVGLCVLSLWPTLPHGARQWGLLIVFGPPVYVSFEILAEWPFSARQGYAIAKKQGTSGSRILVAVLAMATISIVGWWVAARLVM